MKRGIILTVDTCRPASVGVAHIDPSRCPAETWQHSTGTSQWWSRDSRSPPAPRSSSTQNLLKTWHLCWVCHFLKRENCRTNTSEKVSFKLFLTTNTHTHTRRGRFYRRKYGNRSLRSWAWWGVRPSPAERQRRAGSPGWQWQPSTTSACTPEPDWEPWQLEVQRRAERFPTTGPWNTSAP